MSIRHPIAAGRFYPADAEHLKKEIRTWFMSGGVPENLVPGEIPREANARLLGLMLPHAGYVYCGRVIGGTLASTWDGSTAGANLPQRLFILCPNHTGQGRTLGVWTDGHWMTPLGPMAVDAELGQALVQAAGGFAEDELCHVSEHSIEVLLPFLQSLPLPRSQSVRSIVPVCVGTRRPDALRAAGLALARVIQEFEADGQRVGIIVSSDLNHYQSQELTLHKDALALAQVLACDPDGLLTVVERESITMCGAGAMALALFTAHAMGSPWAELALYDTSAAASGDTSRVVGYAGLRFGLA